MFVAVALDGWLLVVVIGCLDWLCVYGCCGVGRLVGLVVIRLVWIGRMLVCGFVGRFACVLLGLLLFCLCGCWFAILALGCVCCLCSFCCGFGLRWVVGLCLLGGYWWVSGCLGLLVVC